MTDESTPAPPRALPEAPQLALPAPEPAPLRGRRSVYALAILAVLLAVSLGYAKGRADLRSEPHHLITEAAAHLREADADVQTVDVAVGRGLDPSGGTGDRDAYEPLLRAEKRLEEALDMVSEAEHEARGKDRVRVRALRQSAQGRLDMLEAASSLLPLQARASDALRDAEAGWRSVRRAAELSDLAAQAFNTHTEAGVTSSTALTAEVESELSSATTALQAASRTMPEASFGTLLDLVEERRRSAAESRRVDAVWLSGKVAEANALLAKLTAEETLAAAERKPLPGAAGEPILAAYERLSRRDLSTYAEARKLADEGDARLAALAQPSE